MCPTHVQNTSIVLVDKSWNNDDAHSLWERNLAMPKTAGKPHWEHQIIWGSAPKAKKPVQNNSLLDLRLHSLFVRLSLQKSLFLLNPELYSRFYMKVQPEAQMERRSWFLQETVWSTSGISELWCCLHIRSQGLSFTGQSVMWKNEHANEVWGIWILSLLWWECVWKKARCPRCSVRRQAHLAHLPTTFLPTRKHGQVATPESGENGAAFSWSPSYFSGVSMSTGMDSPGNLQLQASVIKEGILPHIGPFQSKSNFFLT